MKFAVISKTKKKLKGTKDSRNYSTTCSAVKQSEVVLWIHKTMTKRLSITGFGMTEL
jgi:hypothetical protein